MKESENTKALNLNEINFTERHYGLKTNIIKRMKEVKMFSVKTIHEQIYLLQGEPVDENVKSKYYLTWELCGILFLKSPDRCRVLYCSGKKVF